MARNLVLLFDGTWNSTKDKTNVLHMRESIDSTGEEDPFQPTKYLSGVGTSWHNWLTGGLFGRGLSENIQAGYAWLAGRYVPNDNSFVFGFSRGAYSARSCVGLMRKCGLLRSPDPALVQQAYTLYRDKRIAPEHARAVAFRAAHAREIRVRFIGVWDTWARWACRFPACRSARTTTAGTTPASARSSTPATTPSRPTSGAPITSRRFGRTTTIRKSPRTSTSSSAGSSARIRTSAAAT